MRKIPPPEQLEAYWHALGKFVQRYAEIEANMGGVLWLASGTSWDRSLALFSGTRVRDAVDIVKRLHEAQDKPLSPWLEKAFSKIGELTTFRDRLLHYGIESDGKALLNTNRHRTLPGRAFKSHVTVEQLHDLEADAITVYACLNMYHIEARSTKKTLAMRAREEQIALAPWRHKLPQPVKKPGRSRKADRKQPRPPKS